MLQGGFTILYYDQPCRENSLSHMFSSTRYCQFFKDLIQFGTDEILGARGTKDD